MITWIIGDALCLSQKITQRYRLCDGQERSH